MGLDKAFSKNSVLSELASAAMLFLRDEKVLISPSYQAGQQLLGNLARAGISFINFHVATIPSLASGIAEALIATGGLKRLPASAIGIVIEDIFNGLSDSKSLSYFQKHPINMGIIRALSRTISELRLCGISSSNIPQNCFPSPAKEKDIRALLSEYEAVMGKWNFLDDAGLIALALDLINKGETPGGKKYYIQSSYALRGLEREFIEKLCGGSLTVLPDDAVVSLPRPAGCWDVVRGKDPMPPKTDIERLPWLFATRKAPAAFKDGTIALFSTLGHRNEIREVLRRIVAGGIPVDQAEIVHTDQKTYGDLIYSVCEKLNISVTFSEGFAGHLTGAGRALMGFLLWLKDDFGESHLRRVLESGGFQWKGAEKETPALSSLAYVLRVSGIGWGQDRYAMVLAKKIEEFKKEAADLLKEGEDPSEEFLQNKIKDFSVLKEICETLLALVPKEDKDGKVEFREICKACTGFLEAHVRVTGENDGAFKASALRELETLAEMAESKMSFE
ncbi:MAG: hypothetical protein WCJ71_08160, partial [Candidatus Omnitrophota bacterium]